VGAITYKDMILDLGGIYAVIYDLFIYEKYNEHGNIRIVALIEENHKDTILYEMRNSFKLLYFEKEIVTPDSQGAIDKNVQNKEEKLVEKNLFSGVITHIEFENVDGVYVLKITGKTTSYFLDIEYKNNIYQNMKMLSSEIVKEILKSVSDKDYVYNMPDIPIDEILVQSNETDWNLVKRFASKYELPIFINSNSLKVKLTFGFSKIEIEGDFRFAQYVSNADIDKMAYEKERTKQAVNIRDYINYSIWVNNILPLGSRVKFKGQSMIVGEIERYLNSGNLINRYTLYSETALKIEQNYNDMIKGISIIGITSAINRNMIQVQTKENDTARNNNYWFPYASVAASKDGNGWYCMPQIGEPVRIFFPSSDERDAYVISYSEGYSKNSQNIEEVKGKPSNKVIYNKKGSGIIFNPAGIQIKTGSGNSSIVINNSGNILIKGSSSVDLEALKLIRINSEDSVNISGQEIGMESETAKVELTEDEISINAELALFGK